MLDKHNANRRRHIRKMWFKVKNWPVFEASLRGPRSLTSWT
jgi:hypothetical protein